MKKPVAKKGRRSEMNITLGIKTIERWAALYADNDYAEIEKLVTDPPTTRGNIGKQINAAAKNSKYTMPLSIAKAIQKFYAVKEKAQIELNA